jgi:rifampicin phosphotransferase
VTKASQLRHLSDAGFRVPAFVVIPAEVCTGFLAALSDPPSDAAIRATPVPPGTRSAILAAIRGLPQGGGGLAVRSSMAGEDGDRHSFAGQLDSFLDVRGEADVVRAVRDCWASAFGTRARTYRRERGLPEDPAGIEVIVQHMVHPDVSGVIFTADPVARDPRFTVVSAVAGLGDALVQGNDPGQTWRVRHSDGQVGAVGDGQGEGFGDDQVGAVGEGRLLDDDRVRELADVGARVESLFGRPQDIEFAISGREVFLLQARPITTPLDRTDAQVLWDNSNIVESYAGVTTPLTFSVIREAYAGVYRQFLTLMGVRRVEDHLVRHMLGFYHGRVYYQLQNWYGALALLPAFEANRAFMEQMMGVRQPAGGVSRSGAVGPATGAPSVSRPSVSRPSRRPSGRGLLALAVWLSRAIYLHATCERRVSRFQAQVAGELAAHRDRDWDALSTAEIWTIYRDLEQHVLGAWQAPILTDFFAMVFYGVLRRLVARWVPDQPEIHHDLLLADGDLESLAPLRAVQDLARRVDADPALATAFAPDDPSATLTRLHADASLQGFRTAFDDYLARYGDRCVGELKLETPTLRDDPARLVRLVDVARRSMAGSGTRDTSDGGGLDVDRRAAAQARLATLAWPRRIVARRVLALARRHVRNRENMRFTRTRVFGVLRALFRAVGRRWSAEGVLDTTDDVFYLTVREIWDYAGGTAVTEDLRSLVALRRAAHDRDLDRALPDRFETWGEPYLDPPGSSVAPAGTGEAPDPSGDRILVGTGCCSGRVTGRVRIVQADDDVTDLGGAILVAERTDPGWVFLFPTAAGILIERGSPLSHSAIVARELGKPTVVNIPGLLRAVSDGDRVTVDGAAGVVQVHGPDSDAPGAVSGR